MHAFNPSLLPETRLPFKENIMQKYDIGSKSKLEMLWFTYSGSRTDLVFLIVKNILLPMFSSY